MPITAQQLLQILPSAGKQAIAFAPYAIHEAHLPSDALPVYRGISGEQFHGSNAS